MNSKQWFFISPHLDDVALSCGGLVWDLVQEGHTVKVWTLMAGFPVDENYSAFAQQNHHVWGMSGKAAICMRRKEDRAACAVLGAAVRHFDWLDAIYRRDLDTGTPVVNNNQELFSRLPEPGLVGEIATILSEELPAGALLVFPMGLGGHIDHQAVVLGGERIDREKYFYADYPYILESFDFQEGWDDRMRKILRQLTQDALHAWTEAVLCYPSQLGSFWRDEDECRLALRNYLAGGGGRLWKKSAS